jgi:NADH-quinone oxidoreductase subunit J
MLGTAPLVSLLAAGETSQSGLIPPVVILIMCLVAGAGTVLMLPSRSEAPVRKIGGVVVLGAGLIVAALLVRAAARAPGGGMGVYFWVFSAIALAGALRVVTHTRPVYSALYFVLTVFATAGLFILLWAEFMAAALVLIYAGAILVTYVFVIMLATSSAAPASATAARPRGGDVDGDVEGDDPFDGNGHAAAAPRPAVAGLAEHDAISREPVVAAAIGFALMGVLLFVVFDRATEPVRPVNRDPVTLRSLDSIPPALRGPPAPDALPPAQGPTQELGVYLFRNHVVNLELAGLILTVSMVGAIVIARRRIHSPAPDAAPSPARGRDVFVAPMTPIDDNPHSIPVYGTDNPRQKAYPET